MASPLSQSHSNQTPSLGQTFGDAGSQGEEGERIYGVSLQTFATTISAHHPPHCYEIVHSLNIPRGPQDRKPLDGDVDFAVASGSHVTLIDVKFWRPGFYWSVKMPRPEWLELIGRHKHSEWALWLRRNVLGKTFGLRGLSAHVDGKWTLSQNMAMALERYQSRLSPHGVRVSAAVVFVTAPRKKSFLKVFFLRWPGGIPSFDAPGGFTEIYRRLGAPTPVHPRITELLTEMKRR
jgi:hypothetical protein